MYSPLIQIPGWQELVPGAVYRQENKKPTIISGEVAYQMLLLQKHVPPTRLQVLQGLQLRAEQILKNEDGPYDDELTNRIEGFEPNLIKRLASEDIFMHFVVDKNERIHKMLEVHTGYLPIKLIDYYEKISGELYAPWYDHMLKMFSKESEEFGYVHSLRFFYNADGLVPKNQIINAFIEAFEKDKKIPKNHKTQISVEGLFNLVYDYLSNLETIEKINDVSHIGFEQQMMGCLESYIQKIIIPQGAIHVSQNRSDLTSLFVLPTGAVSSEPLGLSLPLEKPNRKKPN